MRGSPNGLHDVQTIADVANTASPWTYPSSTCHTSVSRYRSTTRTVSSSALGQDSRDFSVSGGPAARVGSLAPRPAPLAEPYRLMLPQLVGDAAEKPCDWAKSCRLWRTLVSSILEVTMPLDKIWRLAKSEGALFARRLHHDAASGSLSSAEATCWFR